MVNLQSHPVPPARFRLHLENARARNPLFHLTGGVPALVQQS